MLTFNWPLTELYKQRGETIERVFADAKEKHGMRYTRLRGLRRVHHHLTLLFACMNLKKLAMWKKKAGMLPPNGRNLNLLELIANKLSQKTIPLPELAV